MAARFSAFRLSKRTIYMGRVVPEIEPNLQEELAKGNVNPKRIKTRRNFGMVRMPSLLQIAAERKIQRFANTKFRREVRHLNHIMHGIKLPDDKFTKRSKEADLRVEMDVRNKIRVSPDDDPTEFRLHEESILAKDQFHQLIDGTLEDRLRDWHYYEYDERAACLYMAARLGANYGAIHTVMREIKAQDPEFTPNTVLDFGSGMGTVNWAVDNIWPNTVREFLNIDLSKDQQDLCELLLRGGKEHGDVIPNVFHRQYLPTSNKTQYDMVVSAFSMLELPNVDMRVKTIENLWHKTNDILVLIERGNKGGFSTIDEARHLILDLGGHQATRRIPLSFESKPRYKYNPPNAHILAPCPHEYFCPRAQMSTLKGTDVCRFAVHYEPLNTGARKSGPQTEEFSYVVFRRGPHPLYDSSRNHAPRWPRIVEPRQSPGGQKIFKLCCSNGSLAQVTITKKNFGSETYKLAKACDWGDILPCRVNDTYVRKSLGLLEDRNASTENTS